MAFSSLITFFYGRRMTGPLKLCNLGTKYRGKRNIWDIHSLLQYLFYIIQKRIFFVAFYTLENHLNFLLSSSKVTAPHDAHKKLGCRARTL